MWSPREPDLRRPQNLEESESIESLEANLAEQIRREAELSDEISKLRERIGDSSAETPMPRLRSLKTLENQEAELQGNYDVRRVELEAEVSELEERLGFGLGEESLLEDLDRLVDGSAKRLDLAKKELAGRLRAVLALKRRIDEVPTQAELIQYVPLHVVHATSARCLCELLSLLSFTLGASAGSEAPGCCTTWCCDLSNWHHGFLFQEKHQQTRKCYDTYNVLLEIKDWMLKEISLLNSISSQFQDAIVSAEGRLKLIASMEGIVKSSQQKLQKATAGLQEEQKVCDSLKKRYATAMAEQRRCYSLLKVSGTMRKE